MTSEKAVRAPTTSPVVSSQSPEALPSAHDADEALDFLKEQDTLDHFAHDAHRMRQLPRKIDLRIIPFLALAYLMNYLDKITLNVCETPKAIQAALLLPELI